MIQINGVEITENLVAILKNLGLTQKDDRPTYYFNKTLIKVNDFLVDYMTMHMDMGDVEDLQRVTNLLVAIKEIRDNIMELDKEFNAILKLN